MILIVLIACDVNCNKFSAKVRSINTCYVSMTDPMIRTIHNTLTV